MHDWYLDNVVHCITVDLMGLSEIHSYHTISILGPTDVSIQWWPKKVLLDDAEAGNENINLVIRDISRIATPGS